MKLLVQLVKEGQVIDAYTVEATSEDDLAEACQELSGAVPSARPPRDIGMPFNLVTRCAISCARSALRHAVPSAGIRQRSAASRASQADGSFPRPGAALPQHGPANTARRIFWTAPSPPNPTTQRCNVQGSVRFRTVTTSHCLAPYGSLVERMAGGAMKAHNLIRRAGFGPDTLQVVFRAFDEAWSLISAQYTSPVMIEATRLKLAQAIIAVSRQDSRDPEVLKRLALQMMKLP